MIEEIRLNAELGTLPVSTLSIISNDKTFAITLYLIVVPVRRRNHWGMGRFCLIFLARILLVRKDFWEGYIPLVQNHTS